MFDLIFIISFYKGIRNTIFCKIMDTSEKFCLQWNDFKENIFAAFGDLRNDRELSDVTLACEDGRQVEAHKIILVSSSPFFMELLKKNKHPHPLIYMRGLKSKDLEAVLDFLYHGEANVLQEDLDSFLALAEELKLKGLAGPEEGAKKDNTSNLPKTKKTPAEKKLKREIEKGKSLANSPMPKMEIQTVQDIDTAVSLNSNKIDADMENLDKQIKSMFSRSEARSNNGQGSVATCNICGKEGPYKAMPRHIEANHITGVTHACDICGKISRSRMHIFTFHTKQELRNNIF